MTRIRLSQTTRTLAAALLALSCGKSESPSVPSTPTATAPPSVASVSISPSTATLQVGQTLQLTAATLSSSGTALTDRTVTWSSSDAFVATVSATGLVTGLKPSSVTITATSEGKAANITVAVVPVPVAVVEVSPATVSVTAGKTAQLTALARDSAGKLLPDRQVLWSSADTTVATVSQAGVVSAVSMGTVTLTATADSKSATSIITVVAPTQHDGNRTTIPVGGNAWILNGSGAEQITANGAVGWQSPGARVRTYFRLSRGGNLNLSISLMGPSDGANLAVTINGITKTVPVRNIGETEYWVGAWTVASAGYVYVDLSGTSRNGTTFGQPTSVIVSGTAVTSAMVFVPNNDNNLFYWGRRGPSTYLNWSTPPSTKIRWVYSEVEVPPLNDVCCSFFMANGVENAYYGMQSGQRNFLFSVWSPYAGDNPSQIPADYRVQLLRKGPSVVINTFGGEGTGGQSILYYPWQTGRTYGFLTAVQPQADSTTDYTSWVYLPETSSWQLLASFRRPFTRSYATYVNSFLENFNPEFGNLTRSAMYKNQWIADEQGNWQEVRQLTFTAIVGEGRLDYDGGLSSGVPFLKMGGFFSDYGTINRPLLRTASSAPPLVDFSKLP